MYLKSQRYLYYKFTSILCRFPIIHRTIKFCTITLRYRTRSHPSLTNVLCSTLLFQILFIQVFPKMLVKSDAPLGFNERAQATAPASFSTHFQSLYNPQQNWHCCAINLADQPVTNWLNRAVSCHFQLVRPCTSCDWKKSVNCKRIPKEVFSPSASVPRPGRLNAF